MKGLSGVLVNQSRAFLEVQILAREWLVCHGLDLVRMVFWQRRSQLLL